MKVPPRPNCLAIVFREPEILNFTKHINCLAKSGVYYVLNCSFFGAASEDDNESESSLGSEVAEDQEDEFEIDSELVIHLFCDYFNFKFLGGRRRRSTYK